MKKFVTLLVLIIIIITALISSNCLGQSAAGEDEGGDETDLDIPSQYDYSGSGSAGDLLVFVVDQTSETYTVYNETTGQKSSGNYSVLPGQLRDHTQFGWSNPLTI